MNNNTKSILFEIAMANQSMREKWISKHNEILKEEKDLIESEHNRLEDIKYNRDKLIEAYQEFKVFAKDTVLQYVIEELMSNSFDNTVMDTYDNHIKDSIIKNYIKENGGASVILRRCSGKTNLLNMIKEEVENTTKEIVDKVDKDNPDSFIINKEDIEATMDKLNKKDNFNDVKDTIAIKVISAEDSFINDNKAEKENIDEIIQQGQEKIDKANDDLNLSDDRKAAIAQEANMFTKRKLVQYRENKRRSVFDEMVHRFAKSCMKREGLHKYYLTENDKLDSERVVKTVKTIYTLMEALSTTKIEIVNEEYIENILNSL